MKQCLIVDDSPIIRKVARLIVEQLDYNVTDAENGEQALELCQQQLPDLILLDWQMPGMSTHEFLKSYFHYFPRSSAQILYCVTEFSLDEISLALAGGISDYIMKPFGRESLQEKIKQMTKVAA